MKRFSSYHHKNIMLLSSMKVKVTLNNSTKPKNYVLKKESLRPPD